MRQRLAVFKGLGVRSSANRARFIVNSSLRASSFAHKILDVHLFDVGMLGLIKPFIAAGANVPVRRFVRRPCLFRIMPESSILDCDRSGCAAAVIAVSRLGAVFLASRVIIVNIIGKAVKDFFDKHRSANSTGLRCHARCLGTGRMRQRIGLESLRACFSAHRARFIVDSSLRASSFAHKILVVHRLGIGVIANFTFLAATGAHAPVRRFVRRPLFFPIMPKRRAFVCSRVPCAAAVVARRRLGAIHCASRVAVGNIVCKAVPEGGSICHCLAAEFLLAHRAIDDFLVRGRLFASCVLFVLTTGLARGMAGCGDDDFVLGELLRGIFICKVLLAARAIIVFDVAVLFARRLGSRNIL